jgi:hypothetical protein
LSSGRCIPSALTVSRSPLTAFRPKDRCMSRTKPTWSDSFCHSEILWIFGIIAQRPHMLLF